MPNLLAIPLGRLIGPGPSVGADRAMLASNCSIGPVHEPSGWKAVGSTCFSVARSCWSPGTGERTGDSRPCRRSADLGLSAAQRARQGDGEYLADRGGAGCEGGVPDRPGAGVDTMVEAGSHSWGVTPGSNADRDLPTRSRCGSMRQPAAHLPDGFALQPPEELSTPGAG